MMVPATRPPNTPAPTAHPQQPASALVGVNVAIATAIAAAPQATRLVFIADLQGVG
jgi:hypothetical protein